MAVAASDALNVAPDPNSGNHLSCDVLVSSVVDGTALFCRTIGFSCLAFISA